MSIQYSEIIISCDAKGCESQLKGSSEKYTAESLLKSASWTELHVRHNEMLVDERHYCHRHRVTSTSFGRAYIS